MIACVVIPGFELRAALRARPGLALQPTALGPTPGGEPLLGPVNAAAEAAGRRRAGMGRDPATPRGRRLRRRVGRGRLRLLRDARRGAALRRARARARE